MQLKDLDNEVTVSVIKDLYLCLKTEYITEKDLMDLRDYIDKVMLHKIKKGVTH